MLKFSKLAGLLAAALLAVMWAAPASAQATRTWVSGVGDDANPCSRTAPCKTFAGAISKTAPGGEIDCLDPGGFGAVTVTKAITLDCGGGIGGQAGSILASGTTGIIVNAAATDRIKVRNLTINGAGGSSICNGIQGINFLAGASLIVEHVGIYGFNTAGVNFDPSTLGAKLAMFDVEVQNNCGDGILVRPTGTGTANATLYNVRAENNTNNGLRVDSQGVSSGAGATAVVSYSVFSHSTNAIQALTVFNSGIPANVTMTNVSAISSNFGILVNGAGGTVRMGGSTITANTNGLGMANGGKVFSFADNYLNGNTTSDGTPLPPTLGKL